MSFTLDPVTIGVAVIALIIGLWLGFLMRSGTKRRAVRLDEQVNLLARERDGLTAERDALRLERDSLDERLRPLAAEVDRLKRAETRRTAPTVVAIDDVQGGPVDAAPIDGGDLRRLKGVGDKFAAALAKLGVTRIDQVAGWSSADAEVIDSQLGAFSGRIRTDRLVEQARLLHEGRTTEYETRFGAL